MCLRSRAHNGRSIQWILLKGFLSTVSSDFDPWEVLNVRIWLKYLIWIISNQRSFERLNYSLNNRVIVSGLRVISWRKSRSWTMYITFLQRWWGQSHYRLCSFDLWYSRFWSFGFISLRQLRSLELRDVVFRLFSDEFSGIRNRHL